MVWLSALAIAGFAFAAAPQAAPPKRQPERQQAFTRPEDLLRWINGYRTDPKPERMPDLVKAASAMGIFRDMETAGVYVGFMAGVIEANPRKAEALIGRMFPLPPEDQVAIVRAIAHSGHPEWKNLLAKFSERMPARSVLIDRFASGKLPRLDSMPLDTGAAPLDMLWGKYFATGSYDPVLRMVSILEWAKDGNNVDRLTVGNMTKLTLATNASRDPALLQMLKASMQFETKETKAVLTEVIDAAETFEFGKVRRDAMASIEQLKTKGRRAIRCGGARPDRPRWRSAASWRAPWATWRWACPASSAERYRRRPSSTWCRGNSGRRGLTGSPDEVGTEPDALQRHQVARGFGLIELGAGDLGGQDDAEAEDEAPCRTAGQRQQHGVRQDGGFAAQEHIGGEAGRSRQGEHPAEDTEGTGERTAGGVAVGPGLEPASRVYGGGRPDAGVGLPSLDASEGAVRLGRLRRLGEMPGQVAVEPNRQIGPALRLGAAAGIYKLGRRELRCGVGGGHAVLPPVKKDVE
jgi:hypothetical protein